MKKAGSAGGKAGSVEDKAKAGSAGGRAGSVEDKAKAGRAGGRAGIRRSQVIHTQSVDQSVNHSMNR